jgi:hypothetical protein
VSRTSGHHRKPPTQPAAAVIGVRARHHRKRLSSPTARARTGARSTGRATAVTVIVAAAVIAISARSFWPAQSAHAQPAADHFALSRPSSGGVRTAEQPAVGFASTLDQAAGTHPGLALTRKKTAGGTVYRNPLRAISGLVLERVDMGNDFGGAGPVYALGRAVITNASADNSGWPGGGWITYRLSAGPAKGLQVYLAEDVTPTVAAGEHVSAATVIAHMYNGGAGIETGWAMPDAESAESQLAVAGGISGGGPFPTEVGLDFNELLQALGVPPAPNFDQSGFGILPPGYPRNWASVRVRK